MIIIMGRAGTGKTSLVNELVSRGYEKIKTCTTRPIRVGEEEGVEYHFTDEEGFQALQSAGKIIEERAYHTFHGLWRYFTVDDGQIKDGDEALGNHVKVKVVKNKMAPPFKKAEFDIVFGEGISRSGEIVDLGVELGIISKSGSWFSYGDSKLAQGREATKQLMLDNVELAEEIEAKIREALASVQD